MMSKYVMFVALFACAIAETFTPDPLPSQFHVTMATKADGKTEITEVYGMHDDEVFYHFEETFDEDNKKLRDLVIRGDLPVDQLFLAVSIEYNDDGSVKECKDGESNAKPRPQLPSFEYDGEPEEDVDCGNGNFDCRKISAGDDYALINKANRYVFVKQSSSEVTYTYYNEGLTDMSLFAVEKCDGSAIAGPEPIGPNPYNTFTPAPLPTYYHVSYPWTDPKDRLNKVHEYGMQNEDVFYFYEVGYDWNDESVKYYDAVVRGDMPAGTSGLFYRVDRDIDDDGTVKCTDDDENAEGRFNNDPFDYVGEPVTVKCDDETLECTKYTDINGEFVIANKDNHYVHTPDGYDLTFYDDGPSSMNMFAVEKCDGTQLTAPEFICGSDSSSSGTSSSGTSSSGTGSSGTSSSGTGSSGTSSSGTSSSGKTSGSTKSSESSKVNSASCSTVSLVMAIVAVALLLI